MFGIPGGDYDKSTGIFSPEGRIFAAEYAKKAVEQGATSIGILCNEGVVLLAEKRVMPLQEPDSVSKISEVDHHIGVAASGFMADARVLTIEARVRAQSYWLTYEEPIPAEALAEFICNKKAQYTQGGGMRPYGVSLIIGAVDPGGRPRLFVTDPVGAYWGYLATVIGRGSGSAGEFLEENYKQDLTLDGAVSLALDALRQASDTTLSSNNVEIAKIPVATGTFHKLSPDETGAYLGPKGLKQ